MKAHVYGTCLFESVFEIALEQTWCFVWIEGGTDMHESWVSYLDDKIETSQVYYL